MDKWMIFAAALASVLAGFTWLALAMEEHWTQVYGESSSSQAPKTVLRMMGSTGLVASGALCFAADRPSMAILVWILFMTFGSVSVAMTLAWKPALLRIVFPGLVFGLQAGKN